MDFDYPFANLPSALIEIVPLPSRSVVDLSQKILFAHILSRSRNLCKARASGHTRQMSASEGGGLMRPFSKKSGGVRCFIDKNCLQENAGQTQGTLR